MRNRRNKESYRFNESNILVVEDPSVRNCFPSKTIARRRERFLMDVNDGRIRSIDEPSTEG